MELLLRARELAYERKFREARALVERAEPESAEELSLAALVLVELRDPEAALPPARRAVELAPDGWQGHLAVADAAYQSRRWDESLTAARAAVRLAPEEAAAHRVLAVAVQRKAGGGRESRQAVKRARELGGPKAMRRPGRHNPWLMLAFVPVVVAWTLLLVRDWPEGVEDILGALRGAPLAVVLLIVSLPSRAGLTWRERIAEIRAANVERYGGGGAAARKRAGLLVIPWSFAAAFGTGLLAEPGRSGDPLPASFVVSVVLVGGCALAVFARRTVRLWYGERFLREVFVPSFVVRVHLVAVGVLAGGDLLLTLGDATPGTWRVLHTWTVVWFLLAMLSGLFMTEGASAEIAAGGETDSEPGDRVVEH